MTGLDAPWSALVTAALLGTARRGLPPAAGPPLQGFGDGPDADPAAALLERAAALVLARRAGARPRPAPPPLVPAPDDDRPPCPPAAARRLARLLAGEHADLLDEWLDRAARAGVALPAEHLVPLLATAEPDRRARVVAAAGPRAGWLAGVLPELAPLVAVRPVDRAAWHTGTVPERVVALHAWRAEAPAEARAALEATLAAERAADRRALVSALATGLGPDDEALLERLLDDRSTEVRATAASLLAGLPGSAFAARQAQRLHGAIGRVEGRRGVGVALALPAEVPAEWRRDGLAAVPRHGVSREASLAAALVAVAPLRAWAAVGPPDVVVGALAAHDDAASLVPALHAAVQREADPAWAAALLAAVASESMLALVTPDVLAATVVARANPSALLQPFTAAACRALAEPWPRDVARAVLVALVGLFEEGRVTWAHRRAVFALVASLDPRLLVPLATALQSAPPLAHLGALQPAVAELARFRHDLVQELT